MANAEPEPDYVAQWRAGEVCHGRQCAPLGDVDRTITRVVQQIGDPAIIAQFTEHVLKVWNVAAHVRGLILCVRRR